MAQQAANKGGRLRLIMIIAIVVLIFAFLASLPRACSDAAGNDVTPTFQTSSGPVTLSDIYGHDGEEVCEILQAHRYTYDETGGYWVRQKGDDVYQFVAMDARGTYVNEKSLQAIDDDVTDYFQIGLYVSSPSDPFFDLERQGVNVTKHETVQAANESFEVAVVNHDGEQNLVTLNRYSMDDYEYEIYSASASLIQNYGVYGLQSRSLASAYSEVLSNYR